MPARSPRQVADDLAARLAPPAGALVLAFVSSRLPPDEVAAALEERLAPATVIGCTSNGEIAGPVAVGTAAAVAITTPGIRFGVGLASELVRGPLQAGRAAVTTAAATLGLSPDDLDPSRHVALTLVDGRSSFAEGFCLGTAATAPRIPFVGGSASDEVGAPPRSAVFAGGTAHRDAGLVVIVESRLAFEVITSEHMMPTPVRTVVTGADPARRVIYELDGHPAAARYEQLIHELGADRPLDNALASSFPLALYVGGRPYVRSIQEVVGAELRLAAVVDEGAILRIMEPGDLVAQTRAALAGARARLGDLSAVITFSCLGRHLEANGRGASAALDDIYASLPVIGFHSFGEQAGPLLVNHTLAALALGGSHAGRA